MIAASCVLHNFMINGGEIDVDEDEVVDNEIIWNNADNIDEIDDRNGTFERNNIMYLFRWNKHV